MAQHTYVTFCFLLVTDPLKKDIWKEWFDELETLKFPHKIFAHCSNPHMITEPWVRQALLPTSVPTDWGNLVSAMLVLYQAAWKQTDSNWITIHSESCVPMCSAKAFKRAFFKRGGKTQLHYKPLWFGDAKRRRYWSFFGEHLVGHAQWCILARQDLERIFDLFASQPHIRDAMVAGPIGDESFVAVCLSMCGRLSYADNVMTTLVAWIHDNQSSPLVFNASPLTADNEQILHEVRKNNKGLLFMRKVGSDFSDDVVRGWMAESEEDEVDEGDEGSR